MQTSQRVVTRLGLHDTDESDSESAPAVTPAAGRKRPLEEPAAARPAKVRWEGFCAVVPPGVVTVVVGLHGVWVCCRVRWAMSGVDHRV